MHVRENFIIIIIVDSQVLVVDPVTPDARSIVKLAESFVIHIAPIRLGIVLDSSKSTATTDATYRAINCAFNYVSQTKTPRDAIGYLTDVSATHNQKQNDIQYSRIDLVGIRRH